jgi:predicted transcriptional regulator
MAVFRSHVIDRAVVMKPANIDHLVSRYLAGETAEQLARELGVKGDTVRAWLKQENVQLRSRAEVLKARKLLNIPIECIVRLYGEGVSEKQIAVRFGIDRGTVRRRLVEAGVTPRGRSEAETLKWSRMDAEGRQKQVAAAHASRVGRFEEDVKAMLGLLGRTADGQVQVGPYFLDLAFHEQAVAVEIETAWSFTLPVRQKRFKHVFDAGWRVLYVLARTGLSVTRVSQQTLSFLEAAGRRNSSVGNYGMIDGQGRPYAARRDYFNGYSRVPGF